LPFTHRGAPSLTLGNGVDGGSVAEESSDAMSLREPNLCAYTQVNSAPSKKIWAE